MCETSCLMPSRSLGPRPITNPSADHFQYRMHYTGRMRSKDETSPVGQNHGITSGEQIKAFAK